MGWAGDAVKALSAGRPVQVRPLGGSMRGRIESGQLVMLTPVAPADVRVDDIVFVRWKGGYLLHLVKQIDGDRFLIGNNVGKTNGWVSATDVLGRATAVDA